MLRQLTQFDFRVDIRLQNVTMRNVSLRATGYLGQVAVSLKINGSVFFSASETAKRAGISRQTLWRWRQGGKGPQGRRFKGRTVVFSKSEAEEVNGYANRLEEIQSDTSGQLSMFGSRNF